MQKIENDKDDVPSTIRAQSEKSEELSSKTSDSEEDSDGENNDPGSVEFENEEDGEDDEGIPEIRISNEVYN